MLLLDLPSSSSWPPVRRPPCVTQQEATRNLRVRDAMLTDFRSLPPQAKLRDGVELLLAGAQQDFPVLDAHGGMQGMLTRHDLISALADNGPEHSVVQVMRRCPDPPSLRLI
jgi:CBS-domain-containing membrane protein